MESDYAAYFGKHRSAAEGALAGKVEALSEGWRSCSKQQLAELS
jgi:hypothetical protein